MNDKNDQNKYPILGFIYMKMNPPIVETHFGKMSLRNGEYIFIEKGIAIERQRHIYIPLPFQLRLKEKWRPKNTASLRSLVFWSLLHFLPYFLADFSFRENNPLPAKRITRKGRLLMGRCGSVGAHCAHNIFLLCRQHIVIRLKGMNAELRKNMYNEGKSPAKNPAARSGAVARVVWLRPTEGARLREGKRWKQGRKARMADDEKIVQALATSIIGMMKEHIKDEHSMSRCEEHYGQSAKPAGTSITIRSAYFAKMAYSASVTHQNRKEAT